MPKEIIFATLPIFRIFAKLIESLIKYNWFSYSIKI